MAAPLGNQFWKARTKHGRDKLFSSDQALWEACCEYFEWVDANPLLEEKIFHTNGIITKDTVAKMRAMTLDGLQNFLDIHHSTWIDWRDKQDFSEVVAKVERIIRDQKFTGAAADLLNANIISRDLGLADKKDLSSSDGTMTPKPAIDATKLSDSTLREIIAAQSKDADS